MPLPPQISPMMRVSMPLAAKLRTGGFDLKPIRLEACGRTRVLGLSPQAPLDMLARSADRGEVHRKFGLDGASLEVGSSEFFVIMDLSGAATSTNIRGAT